MKSVLVIVEAHGKKSVWTSLLREMGISAHVFATGGHFVRFPDRLFPLGIDLRGRRMDSGRTPDPEVLAALGKAVDAAASASEIWIATDPDAEGDVIALDVIEAILAHRPDRASVMLRISPGAMSREGMESARQSAVHLGNSPREILKAAIYGRARAITDRWIGGVFSREAGIPVGRVRSAIIGSLMMLERAPRLLKGRPETGEITFQARSDTGGRPFLARIPITGSESREQIDLYLRMARKWRGRLVPGVVRQPVSLSAAVAPRIGRVCAFNTGDALVYAVRHHGLTAKSAMQGLQDAYMRGHLSYPRTEARSLSPSAAVRTSRLGYACGLEDLNDALLSEGYRPDQGHEALHPTGPLSGPQVADLRRIMRRPITPADIPADRDTAMEIMIAMVTRRCFEAARNIVLDYGTWRPDNATRVNEEEAQALEDLEWVRERNFTFPWSKSFTTDVRQWSDEAVVLETMLLEGLGRPATYAAHVGTALASGDIETSDFPAPPRPSPQGIQTLKRTPKSVWNPETCRFIEDSLSDQDGMVGEDEDAPLHDRIRNRVLFWLKNVRPEMRDPLIAALSQSAAGGSDPSLLVMDDPDLCSPDTDLPSPAPVFA